MGRWKLCRGQGGLSGKPLVLFPEAMLKPDQLVGEVFDTFPSATTSILCKVFHKVEKAFLHVGMLVSTSRTIKEVCNDSATKICGGITWHMTVHTFGRVTALVSHFSDPRYGHSTPSTAVAVPEN